jgi:hypothetical protein
VSDRYPHLNKYASSGVGRGRERYSRAEEFRFFLLILRKISSTAVTAEQQISGLLKLFRSLQLKPSNASQFRQSER